MMGATLLALIAVIFVGDDTFGSTRTFFGGRVQPSEPAKIAIIIYISTWLASKGSSIRNVKVGLAPFAVLLGIVTLLLISQPDISTAILIVSTAFLMFFIAGAEIRQLIIVGAGGTITFWLIIHYSIYARNRVELFLESFRNPILSTEWQVEQAIRAFVRGGIFGAGLGNAQAKLPGHLPVSWSDNIFAVVGEELGLFGAVIVMLLFALLAYRGLRTALMAPDSFGALLATGITALLILQALLNMAVAVAISPPTGVTLPFISYGGSSMVTVLAGVGILLSISRAHGKFDTEESVRGRSFDARNHIGGRNRGTRLPSPGGSQPTSAAEAAYRGSRTVANAGSGRRNP